jgi:DnaJ-class molecular chaperone
MPHPSYWYDCHGFGGGRPTCHTCGIAGRYTGYRNSVVEYWCRFNRVTGLSPFGSDPDHTPEERKAILDRLVECSLCDGQGFLSSDPETWVRCPRCLSDGSALDGAFKGVA